MDLTERFLNYIKHEKRYSPNTIRAYTDDIRCFSEFIKVGGGVSLPGVKPAEVRSWLVYLAGTGISARTYKRKLSSVKAFYKFLLREGVIEQMPTEAVIMPKYQNPLPDFFSHNEINALFDNITFNDGFTGKRDKLIMFLFYITGMRLSELINIRLRDVDFSLQHIRVTGKRNKQRAIPVSPGTLKIIDGYIKARGEHLGSFDNNGYLFVKENGEKVYPRMVQKLTSKYLSGATTSEKTNPHKFRHTFATHMLNNGADLNAVKEILGHASLAATEVYTHNTYEKLKSIYKQAHPRA
ncbi:MAG: tyrosine-type recombinase/integrase [Bacteroidales bacterium]|nr:tyrosine-type recombinase/integrase [Bacteroidales bacterium]